MTDNLPLGAKLWIENGDGAAKAHVVVPVGKPYFGAIGGRRRKLIDVRRPGAGCDGPFPVPFDELTEAAPTTPAEEAEYARLDAELAGQARYEASKMKRFNALRLRWLLFGEAKDLAA